MQPGVELNGDGGGQRDPGVRPSHRATPGVTLSSMQHKHLYTHFCLVWPDEWSSDIIRGRDETADQGLHNDALPRAAGFSSSIMLYLDMKRCRVSSRAVNEPSQSFTLKAPNSVFAIKNPPSILIFSIVKALAGALNKEEALVSAFSGHCKNSRRFVDSFSVQCVHVAAGLLTSARLSVKLPAGPALSWPRLHLNVCNYSKNVR